MKEKVLKLYYAEGTELKLPFPNASSQIEIYDFTYDARRMSGSPTISASIMYDVCLDNLWKDSVYTEFDGERFFLKNTPSSDKNNEDSRYKHDLTFVSGRAVLDNIYFYDVVTAQHQDKPVSNSARVFFFGGVREFAERLNASLIASGVGRSDSNPNGYYVVVDDEVTSEEKQITFDKQYFSNVLQEIYNTFNVPYYFVGKVIHIGKYDKNSVLSDITFKYGADYNLLSVGKSNTNNKIVNRIAAEGSSENIPYYYPNDTELGQLGLDVRSSSFTAWSDSDKLAKEAGLNAVFVFNKATLLSDKFLNRSTERRTVRNLGDRDPHEAPVPEFYTDLAIGMFSDKLDIVGDCVVSLKRNTAIDDAERYIDKATFKIYERGNEENVIFSWDFRNGLDGVINEFIFAESDKSYVAAYECYYQDIKGKYKEVPPCYVSVGITCNYWNKDGKPVELSKYGIGISSGSPRVGDEIRVKQINYIQPSSCLMPPIYRSKGERFYNALNDTYDDGQGGLFHFDNPYVEGKPNEHLERFEHIKPSIVGMENGAGKRIDMFADIAFDRDDNNETYEKDGELVYKHPYFFVKLHRTYKVADGVDYSFNLFKSAIEGMPMTINMTSGVCGAHSFEVAVDKENKKYNTVQVDGSGNLVRDEFGDVVCGREGKGDVTFQDIQQDTAEREVWIALKKDIASNEGQVMPLRYTFEPKPNQDTFVITNIKLPKAYILDAEKRLEKAAIEYMAANNSERFNFSIKFSRIYLAQNPQVLDAISENSQLYVEYNGVRYELYVNSYSYKMSANETLPEIAVDLKDEISVVKNTLDNTIGEIKQNVMLQIQSLDILDICSPHFIKKNSDDYANGTIDFNKVQRFNRGADFLGFKKGYSGAGIYQDKSGNSTAEVDVLNVRKKARFNVVEIAHSYHLGGAQISSAASCVCDFVRETIDAYRIYFRKKDSDNRQIYNQWMVGDQAYVSTFNLQQNHYWWRAVIGTSNDIVDDVTECTYNGIRYDTRDFHFIDVSKNAADAPSDRPKEGDQISLLGYRGKDPMMEYRKNAVYQSAVDGDSPYYKQFTGITDFHLPEPTTQLQSGDNRFNGRVTIQEGSTGAANLTDLPDVISDSFNVGGENLLRNSGFDGEHESIELSDKVDLSTETDMYNVRMEYWEGDGESVAHKDAVSGYSCRFSRIYQSVKLISGEVYVIGFYSDGDVNIVCGEEIEYKQSTIGSFRKNIYKFTSVGETRVLFTGDNVSVWDLKLERGTIATSWCPNVNDQDKTADKFKELWYLQQALKEGSTDILGGIILSSIINLGRYKDGKMEAVTAGMSGAYNDDNDVAMWGGGTLSQAISAVAMYAKNPLYVPTEEELRSIAKVVITHGGRAILQDVVLRGYVYAEGGKFRGRIEADQGYFRGFVTKGITYITPKNISQYLRKIPIGNDFYIYEFAFEELSPIVVFIGDYFEAPSEFKNITFTLPSLRWNGSFDPDPDLARSFIGTEMFFYNRAENISLGITGAIVTDDNSYEYSSQPIPSESLCRLSCKLRFQKINDGDLIGTENVYWLYESGYYVNNFNEINKIKE